MPTTSDFKRVLTREALRQLAGARSFERGEDYFAASQVASLVEHAGQLTATVQGTEDYRVKISKQFAGYLAAVRAAHKPKRNFIKLAARL
jgi:uncharacterized Zn finger protein